MPRVKIGPATELQELRALPEREEKTAETRRKETRFGDYGVAVAKADVCHSRCGVESAGVAAPPHRL
jgi:hypothetical protein